MASNIFCETIALAALFQSAVQIQAIARYGTVNEHAIAPLMRALIITDPDEVTDVYDPQRLTPGLNNLISCLSTRDSESPAKAELKKIASNMMLLENNLNKQKVVFDKLSNQVDNLRLEVLRLHSDYETANDNIILDYDIIKKYSKIYSDLISPNFPKLIIYGEEQFLRRTELQEMIRALLLAGIRACVLWYQVGGRSYSFRFKTKEFIAGAQSILSDQYKNS